MIKVLHSTKFLDFKAVERGELGDWTYVHRPNAKDVVVIVPVIKNSSVLFLKTSRPPLVAENKAQYCIELPAGLVGDIDSDETVLEALNKELLEETGLVADKIEIKSRKLSSSGGLTSETITLALAYISDDTIKQKPLDDDGIIIDRYIVPINEAKTWLENKESEGFAISAHALAGLFYVFVG